MNGIYRLLVHNAVGYKYTLHTLTSTENKQTLNHHYAEEREGNLPISSPCISRRERVISSAFRRDGARPKVYCVGLPKRTESGLVVRSNTTLQAPLSPYIAATAKVAAGETWLTPDPRS